MSTKPFQGVSMSQKPGLSGGDQSDAFKVPERSGVLGPGSVPACSGPSTIMKDVPLQVFTRTHHADVALAASLQAEVWSTPDQASDAKSAARCSALQYAKAAHWRLKEDALLGASLQAEEWQECGRRMTSGPSACRALPLQDRRARPPTATALPPEPEVNTAASRLYYKLSDYGLVARDIAGDGACQFRAVADQLYGDQELHAAVRNRAVEHLRVNADKYGGFVIGESFKSYLERMAKPYTWGDNLTLQAIADTCEVEICIVSSFHDRSFLQVLPVSGRASQQAWLGFYAEYHYTSLTPVR